MEDTGGIVRYLKEKYQPETILVYGSFADGSNNRKFSSSRLPPRSARDGRHWRPSPFFKRWQGCGGRAPAA